MSLDHKRKISSDGLTANPKRREVSNKEETSDEDNDNEDEEMVPDSPYTSEDSNFSLGDISWIHFILNRQFVEVLSRKVETDFELKQLAKELFQSLRNAVEDGEQVSSIVAGVKKLFESDVFVQACVETYMEDPHLLVELEPNFNTEGKEQMEALKRDMLFPSILQETQTNAIIRGVLTVVFGYWSDKDCYNKVSEAVNKELQKLHKPNNEPPVRMVYHDIPNIDVSPDIEGLKEALAIRYRDDPNQDYNHICEEVDSNKSYFEEKLNLSSVVPGMIPKRITRLVVAWSGKSLKLGGIDFVAREEQNP
ncbi:unnamed protein product [Cuscuta campestris]|uniref:Uncharacterized protein n=1 Tax=Cuscuta campestris TaxID=132261 RepID=A0A484KIF2_9ASTE|nr:unnamed protein product [Cuscuta campestris]